MVISRIRALANTTERPVRMSTCLPVYLSTRLLNSPGYSHPRILRQRPPGLRDEDILESDLLGSDLLDQRTGFGEGFDQLGQAFLAIGGDHGEQVAPVGRGAGGLLHEG